MRMTILPSNFRLPRDLQEPALVAGRGSDMEPVVITGGYTADFYGIEFQVTTIWCLMTLSRSHSIYTVHSTHTAQAHCTALFVILWPLSSCIIYFRGKRLWLGQNAVVEDDLV